MHPIDLENGQRRYHYYQPHLVIHPYRAYFVPVDPGVEGVPLRQ